MFEEKYLKIITLIATTITAVAAVTIATWQAHEARVHNRQSVIPILNVKYSEALGEEGISIKNKGTGPAIIQNLTIYVLNGAALVRNVTVHKTWPSAINVLGSNSKSRELSYYVEHIPKGFAIAPGENIHILHLPSNSDTKTQNNLLPLLKLIDFTIQYQSIYMDKFEIRGGMLGELINEYKECEGCL